MIGKRRLKVGILLVLLLWMVPEPSPAFGAITFLNTWGSVGTGNGEFDGPWGLAVASTGDVYVADSNNHRIQQFTNSGTFLNTWGSQGSGNGQFDRPVGVAVAPTGQVYVVDPDHDRVQQFTSGGTFLNTWGSQGRENGQFIDPWGVAVAPTGQVYVADYRTDRIQQFTSGGTFLNTWGSSGSGNGQFDEAWDVAVAPTGQVYVLDTDHGRIQQFTSEGTFLKTWGSEGSGNGQLFNPRGVAVAATGQVYVADFQNDRVQRFTSDGTFLNTLGSEGSGNGQFDFPRGVAVASTGEIYVTDAYHRIQRFFDFEEWISGTLRMVAPGPGDFGIGVGEMMPDSLTLDANKHLIADGIVKVHSNRTLTVEDGGQLQQGVAGVIGIGTTTGLGNGRLNVTGGSLLQPTGQVVIGGSGNQGVLDVQNGASLETADLLLADSGVNNSEGYATFQSGAQATIAGDVRIGSAGLPGQRGELLISGAGTTVNHSGSSFTIGAAANSEGLLHVTDRAQLTSVAGGIVVKATGQMIVNGGTLESASLTVDAGGIVDVPGSTVDVSGTLSNSGEIRLGNAATARLDGGTLSNSGLLQGSGRIGSALTNQASGEVRADSGYHLLFEAAGSANNGRFNLFGGTLEFEQDLSNETGGLILGQGTLSVSGGLDNFGTVALSAPSSVLGDLTNGGLVTLSGIGNTLFFDDVLNDGEIHISGGSGAVFYGGFNGGEVTGAGTAFMEGDLTPGSSPGQASFGGNVVFGPFAQVDIDIEGTDPGQYDTVTVAKTVDLRSQLNVLPAVSYSPTLGDSFNLIRAASGRTGLFDRVNGVPIDTTLGYAVTYDANNVDARVSLLGDADLDDDVDTVDITHSIGNFTGNGNVGRRWALGDFDGDGDNDTADVTTVISKFTGASSPTALRGAPGEQHNPDLIYDMTTGELRIDADATELLSFSLLSHDQFTELADFAEMNADVLTGIESPLVDNGNSQIGWVSALAAGGVGFDGPELATLGSVLPHESNQHHLATLLARYIWSGPNGTGGSFDLVTIPEPSGMTLVVVAALVLVARTKRD